MDLSLVSWIITGVIAVIILFGALFGAIRGLKKTTIRGIWLIVTAVIIYFISVSIVKSLMNLDISFIGVGDGGEVKLSEFISTTLEEQVGQDFAEENAALFNAMLNLVPMVLAPIVFTLLFWLLKFILYPFYLAFTGLFFPSAKQKFKKQQRKQRKLAKQSTLGFADYINGDEQITPITNQSQNQPNTQNKTMYQSSSPFSKTTKGNAEIENKEIAEYMNKLNQLKRENQEIRNGKNLVRKQVQSQEPNNQEMITPEPTNQIVEEPIVEEPTPKQKEPEQMPIIDYKPPKEKKHRFFGMLVGVVVALFICCCTLLPINGIISTTQEINKHKALLLEDETKRDQGYLTALTDGTYDEIVNCYNNALGVKVLKYTGVQATSIFGFNNLATAKKGKIKVKLSTDVERIMKSVDIAGKISTIDKNNIKNYSVAQLESLISDVEDLIENIFDVELLNYIGTFGFDFVFSIFNEEMVLDLTGDQKVANIVNASIKSIKNLSQEKNFEFKSLESEFLKIVNIFRTLNKPEPTNQNNSVLKRIVSNDFDKPLVIFYNLGNDYVQNVLNSIFEMRIGSDILPVVTDTMLEVLFESQNIEYEPTEITTEAINNSINQVINSMFEILDGFNLEAEKNEDYLKNDANIMSILQSVGKILDTLKTTYLSENNYKNAVTKLTDAAAKELEKAISDDYIGLRESLVEMIKKSKDSTLNWQSEMANLGSVIHRLKSENILTNSSNDTLKVKLENLSIIGELLDDLEFIDGDELKDESSAYPSKIFNFKLESDGTSYNSMVKVISEAINYAKTLINDEKIQTILDKISNNVLNAELVDYDSTTNNSTIKQIGTVDWTDQFSQLNDLFKTVNDIINKKTSVDSISAIYKSNIIKEFGSGLDSAKNSIFLKGITNEIVGTGLDYAKSFIKVEGNDSLNQAIKSVLSDMKNILDNESTIIESWENEFSILNEFVGVAATVSTEDFKISSLPTLMKNIENNINNPVIDNKSILVTNKSIQNIIVPAIDSILDSVTNQSIKTAILSIKANLQSLNFEDPTNPNFVENTAYFYGLLNFENTCFYIDSENYYQENYTNAYWFTSNKLTSLKYLDSEDLVNGTLYTLSGKTYLIFNLQINENDTRYYGIKFIEDGSIRLVPFVKNYDNTYSFLNGSETIIGNNFISSYGDYTFAILNPNMGNEEFINIYDCTIVMYQNHDSSTTNNTKPASDEICTMLNTNNATTFTDVKEIINDIETKSTFIRNNETADMFRFKGFWEKEFDAICDLYELQDQDTLELSTTIGQKLDNILNHQISEFNSKIITEDIVKKLIADEIVNLITSSSQDKIGAAINNAATTISNNLKSDLDILSWEKEFYTLSTISDLNFESLALGSFDYSDTTTDNESQSGIGSILDEIIDINSQIVTMEILNSIIGAVLEDKTSILTDSEYSKKFGNIATTIISNFETYNHQTTYDFEFKCIQLLLDLKDFVPADYSEIMQDENILSNLGNRLDLLLGITDDSRNPSVLTATVGKDIVSYLIETIGSENKDNCENYMSNINQLKGVSDTSESDYTTIISNIKNSINQFNVATDTYSKYFADLDEIKTLFVNISNLVDGTPTADDINNCNNSIANLENAEEKNLFMSDDTLNIIKKYFFTTV